MFPTEMYDCILVTKNDDMLSDSLRWKRPGSRIIRLRTRFRFVTRFFFGILHRMMVYFVKYDISHPQLYTHIRVAT